MLSMSYFSIEIIIKAKNIKEAEEIADKKLELVNMESKPTDLTIGVIRRTSNPFNNTRQLSAR